MSKMGGCNHFSELCLKNNKTVVKNCKDAHPVLKLVDGADAKSNAISICQSMKMDGCGDCTSSNCPSPLLAYSKLCNAMQHMKECTAWSNMCSSNPDELGVLCGDAPSPTAQTCAQAPMNMLFHSDVNDAVFFEGVYVCNTPPYILVCLVFVLSGCFYAYLKTVKQKSIASLSKKKGLSVYEEATSLCLTFVLVTMSYLIMLIAMTYNVGYFLSCMVGLAVGQYVLIEKPKILRDQTMNGGVPSVYTPLVNNNGHGGGSTYGALNKARLNVGDEEDEENYNCCD